MKRTHPLRRPINRGKHAQEKTMPPPVGGWNEQDSLASMPPTDAVELVNWYPRPTHVETRPGSQQAYCVVSDTVYTLMKWQGLTGTEHLIFTTSAGMWRLTSGVSGYTPPGSTPDLGTRTEPIHNWIQFGDGTNNWLMAFNGVDKPLFYNGSTYTLVDGVSSPAITGLTTTDIISAGMFKERVLLIRKNKLGFDYLPAGAAGGAASFFDLSSIAELGGYLMAIAVWSRDTGNGPDDYAVFLTSEGEAIVYEGTDPSSATTWSLVGTFRIGKPLGRKCVLKYGASPLILTQSGIFPLESLLKAGEERSKFAVSYKIQHAFTKAANAGYAYDGWGMTSFPEHDMLLVNVPTSDIGHSEQFVMNTITKAWCRFQGWNARDFLSFGRSLYYSKGNSIYQCWLRDQDEYGSVQGVPTDGISQGTPITYTARQSFQGFGTASVKHPLSFMPLLESPLGHVAVTGIDSNFIVRDFPPATVDQDSGVMKWGIGQWGISRWGRGSGVESTWQGASCWPGRWLSGKLKIQTQRDTSIQDLFRESSTINPTKWLGSVMRFIVGDSV